MKNTMFIATASALALLLTSCEKAPEPVSGFEAVDLGLSVKWAAVNVGAAKPTEIGSYFAWGETSDKDHYDWAEGGDYAWGVYDETDRFYGMTRYEPANGGDGRSVLTAADDPATVNMGAEWRTPTLKEIDELHDDNKCEWIWDDSRKGYVVRGKATGNSIFLPAAGRYVGSELEDSGLTGSYWSSSVYDHCSHVYITIFSEEAYGLHLEERRVGLPVRAVRSK